MPRRKLVWHIFWPFLTLTVLTLIASSGYGYQSLRGYYQKAILRDLESRARLIADEAAKRMATEPPAAIDAWCKRLGSASAARLTMVRRDGLVLGDSHEDPAVMDNHGTRPEIEQAYAQGVGSAARFSNSLNEDGLYVALPLHHAGELLGVVRTSEPLTAVNAATAAVIRESLIGLILIALLATAVSAAIARRITRPINQLRAGAGRFAQGNLSARLPMPDAAELAALATSMNQMAEELDERMRVTREQHNELTAVWSSMSEGVVAFDRDGEIIHTNEAAAQLLNLADGFARGRSLYDALPQAEVKSLTDQLFEEGGPVEGDLVIEGPSGEHRQVNLRGAILRDGHGESMGGLFIFSDVTQLRRLETARKDFVANVSHEIKTPITSIRGYAETLLDGALADEEAARRFLRIIVRQSDRLTALVEDVLALAQIEEQKDRRSVVLEFTPVQPVIEAALHLCQPEADAKSIGLEAHFEPGLQAPLDPSLLEQAVVNLVANAVKYSSEGTCTRVRTYRSDDQVCIAVEDEGPGIATEHLSRLFERFYRVDKARSRRAGGTGLGLAIVKHVVELHHGHIRVTSSPGQGATFTISLPGEPSALPLAASA